MDSQRPKKDEEDNKPKSEVEGESPPRRNVQKPAQSEDNNLTPYDNGTPYNNVTPVTEQNYRDYLNNDVEYYSPPQNPANDKLIITKVEPQLETRPSALTEEIRQYDEKQKSQQAG